MKFEPSGSIDAMHCLAIKHEYLRCRDMFEVFRDTATGIVLSGHSREAAYRAYNAYSGFILHLYEFLIALHARDYGDTEVVSYKAARASGYERADILDALVNEDAERVVQNRIDRINRGSAPSHENAIDYYYRLLPLPTDFAKTFRRMRNKVGGHVTYERLEEIDLTAFYQANHPYLYLLYRDLGDYWGRHCEEIPDLANVTDFFKAVLDSETPEGARGE
ncbi:hypothetical protein [Pseudomonas sp. BR20]|uniref:hypothetical protein n=1 Tax=Pseudomonas sp. BR20 TaxID=3137452 RepID=UPI003D6FCAF5